MPVGTQFLQALFFRPKFKMEVRAMPKVIVFKQKGNWKKTRKFLKHCSHLNIDEILEQYGQQGVEALKFATPRNTGKTAESWSYEIVKEPEKISIIWRNDNLTDGIPVAVLLQYGHGTRNGGYVEGIDYINPAMRPIFERIAARAWGEVKTQ